MVQPADALFAEAATDAGLSVVHPGKSTFLGHAGIVPAL
jgi:hypothetical protein